jgi:hypothetical protein
MIAAVDTRSRVKKRPCGLRAPKGCQGVALRIGSNLVQTPILHGLSDLAAVEFVLRTLQAE